MFIDGNHIIDVDIRRFELQVLLPQHRLQSLPARRLHGRLAPLSGVSLVVRECGYLFISIPPSYRGSKEEEVI